MKNPCETGLVGETERITEKGKTDGAKKGDKWKNVFHRHSRYGRRRRAGGWSDELQNRPDEYFQIRSGVKEEQVDRGA